MSGKWEQTRSRQRLGQTEGQTVCRGTSRTSRLTTGKAKTRKTSQKITLENIGHENTNNSAQHECQGKMAGGVK